MTDISTAKAWLAEARHPVSFSGAGLSAESGIATFRDPDGVWAEIDPEQMASPHGFSSDPERVVAWYNARRRANEGAKPNPAHLALSSQSHMIHITQNVDGLLEAAGATNVLHLHGTLTRDRCHAGCGYAVAATKTGLYHCPECGGAMRPDVVWFGEMLAGSVVRAAETAAYGADVMLVVGTSAVVYPAAGLIEMAYRSGAKIVVVNQEPLDLGVGVELIGNAGDILPDLFT
ncbi:MAG: NAD-dependent deacylase [Acidimicrobiia bacterium]|nr:NAD-dependent deacylase [Acidimicrobiia bacterium]NNC42951.1 NAD-dependent deacylase [Acidimicrobiia bacterium]NND13779.1 NAD-dependent deacylase [Acidimicrobiia bacterium]NNL28814.1 NAD-dependent deacylase [Acidimicrobiia bacterium]